MKIVITCGDPLSGFADVHLALQTAGLQAAQLSRQEKLSAQALQQMMCAAHEVATSYEQEPVQLSPGVVWHSLCVDLFMANLESSAWGWADHATVHLLDFWRDFDPQTRFVLVYSSPERTINRLLNGPNGSSRIDIRATIGAWVHYNRAILRFFLRNRDRCALVNNEALSLVNPSSRLLSFLPGDLGERLPEVVQAAGVDVADPVIRRLAPELLAAIPEADALYQELEASADIATPQISRDVVTVQGVLEQYFSVKVKLVEAASKATESQALISDLREKMEEQQGAMLAQTRIQVAAQTAKQQLEAQVHQYQSRIQQLQDEAKKARDEAGERAKAEQECALLLVQLHQVQEELEACLLREKEAQQAKVGALNDGARLEKELQQLRSQTKHLQDEAEKARKELAAGLELKQENGLLLQQLHQVQEELESYFLKYQELVNKQSGQASIASSSPPATVADSKPVGMVEVDLRGRIDGANWYYAESDGRWAGPGTKSSLKLPAPVPGRYELVLGVVDAMAPDIVRDMKISFNGQPLAHKGPREWKFMRRLLRKKRYPATVVAEVEVVEQAPNAAVTIAIEFPRVVSPSSRGSDDQRQLAVRVQHLRLVRL